MASGQRGLAALACTASRAGASDVAREAVGAAQEHRAALGWAPR